MTADEMRLLRAARLVLERYMFDDAGYMRDDVAELCMKLDDVLLPLQTTAASAQPDQAAA